MYMGLGTCRTFQAMVMQWAWDAGVSERTSPLDCYLEATAQVGKLTNAVLREDLEGVIAGVGGVLIFVTLHLSLIGMDLPPAQLPKSVVVPCESDVVTRARRANILNISDSLLAATRAIQLLQAEEAAPSDCVALKRETITRAAEMVIQSLILQAELYGVELLLCGRSALDQLSSIPGQVAGTSREFWRAE
ncbi:hypothetical protein [Pseudomonas aeruginosa]|uniref:hypothetical protein n=1 Tax=Pseudomonas aeruginosa TaxID=287 RepID=UPI0005B765C0|nr:hypothetical protein [Pseudomonas aeruginosa]MBV6139984.1 hypothetical protein [Pseudomonas aeruginosa]OZO16601.1 hypothetical protein CGU42_16310 [Pseudomonas aeruginosa]RPW15079.1 hypothetical protein IPC752_27585 [Pseudomonas aeruginosa]RUG34967.1 hypothetical protein IPC760_27565 [Pseudomonas aeruginosa]HCK0579798.1 hypothetical protein [Pseudomonas aeruginosa]